ncbi:MAG TPA: hypothetical protein VKA43_17800 [Gammaproteobacteria bacterium]|nr:hypothetical protein [Gammaproteobacteria bacterium]
MSRGGPFDLVGLFHDRGLDLAALGGAYLVVLATIAATLLTFAAARHLLVISPNRGARDYSIYVSLALATLLVAIVLENESLPAGSATLHYAAVPQLLLLLGLHLAVWHRQEPWLVALGGSATAATVLVGALLALTTSLIGPAYWVAFALLTALLVFLWRKAILTQRAFVTASSIYMSSKETLDAAAMPQKPWLGLTQWSALVAASVSLAIANALLRGRGIEEIPAVDIATDSVLLLLVTTIVCAVPAASYWLMRKAWMPELTRFVWLAWIVVGFALTYGNYLSSLRPA